METQPLSSSSSSTPSRLFSLFLYVVIFTNFDTGVIPASLAHLQKDLSLSKVSVAALGTIPYFGICVASLSASGVIKRINAKKTLFLSLIGNAGFCALFSVSSNLWILYISRFFMGFTQAFWVVYGPVWTNYYSPQAKKATWLGIMQGFSPLGIIVGYLVTGILIENINSSFSWRLSFLLQSLGEIPPLIILLSVDLDKIDFLYKESIENSNREELQVSSFMDIIQDFKVILANYFFLCVMMSVCVAYFVVISIQFWATLYLIEILGEPPTRAMIMYGFLTITSPILGVFFGGFLSDKFGGFRKENVLNTLQLSLAFSIVCVFVAIPSGFVYKPYFWVPLVWVQVFFGACNMPASTGLVVNSVEKKYHTSAFAFAQFVYNILAFFFAPIFGASIMDSFAEKKEGLMWGFRATQLVSSFGVFFLIIAIMITMKKNLETKASSNSEDKSTKMMKNEQVDIA